MAIAIITGSAGLIGSEAVKFFAAQGLTVVGIDNNLRETFFGEDASTTWNLTQLQQTVPNYIHHDDDIRQYDSLAKIFSHYAQEIKVVIHCAAQPSHDWAALQPLVDFTVNANGTLNLLELTRLHCPQACFMHLSTNKVYGDTPNFLPLTELATRFEIATDHPYHGVGIDENMSIDHCKHSLFGVSKAAADLMVQEYGRYFGMNTACFRGGCLTGPAHSGTRLHGFLSYVMRCTVMHKPFTIYGYQGKQVRDNIHSYDLVNALWHFYQAPKVAAVYNMGGGPGNECSVLEAITLCEQISDQKLHWDYAQENRIGDHIWWVSDVRKFKADFPQWDYQYTLRKTLIEIFEATQQQAKQYEYA